MYSGLIGCDDTPSVREPNSVFVLPTFWAASVSRNTVNLFFNWPGTTGMCIAVLMLNTYNSYGVLNSGVDTFQNANNSFTSAPLVDNYARLVFRGYNSPMYITDLARNTSYTIKVYGISYLRDGVANGLIKLELAFSRQFTTSN